MKRITSYLLSAIFILSCLSIGAFASGEPRYTLSDTTVNAGDVFTVEVAIADNPGIISLRFKVEYDSTALELQSVTDTGLLKGYTAPSPTIASPYTLRWADSLATSDNSASGTVVKLTFKALKGTETTVTVIHEEARTCNGKKIAFAGISASINITSSIVTGDIDGDEDVTMKDVLVMRRYIAGLLELSDEQISRGDFDGDEDITMKDVLKARRIIAGLD